MQPRATAIVSLDRDHMAGELRTRADDMRGGLRRQGAQAREEALRTLLVDRFDCTPVLVAGYPRLRVHRRRHVRRAAGGQHLSRRPLPPDFCRLFLQFLSPTGRALGEDVSIFSFSKMAFHLRTQSLDASTALNCKVHRRISPKGDRMKSSLGRVQLAFVLLCLVAVPAHANLLTNGSFEAPIVSVGGFTNFPVGSGALTGWTVFGPAGQAVSIVSGSFSQNGVSFPAQDGAQWVDLTGFNNNSTEGVSQSVATTVGHQYQLSYFIGNTTGGGIFGSTSTVDVLLNGAVAFTDTNSTSSPSTQNWGQFSHTFTASGAATIIGLRNADPGTDNDNGLDNVVLLDLGVPGTSVPEPGTLVLFGLGLAGLGGITWRRHRRT